MKKEELNHYKFDSISEAHKFFSLPKPQHPLVSLVNHANNPVVATQSSPYSHVLGFYKMSYKEKSNGKLRYGQSYYDFDEGGLLFASPNQVIGNNDDAGNNPIQCSRYTLLMHPDFLWNHPLAKKIKQYGFFSYTANEALYLSNEEEATIISIFQMIEREISSRIDDFSQDIVIAQIELLLNFANRFYKRQFITRKVANSDILQQLDDLLSNYFNSDTSLQQGLPSVQLLADHVNLSPSYLSDMLRSQTGQNAQQYIHIKLIEKAKEILSTTNLTVSEVAYALGFEHPQSFSKLFKSKTNLSPLEFRRSFN